MEVTLENTEIVKDRTGCTYKEAKEALEEADGSVVDAIIAIEEKQADEGSSEAAERKEDHVLLKKMKELVEKGNVSRILVSRNGRTLVNFPVTVSVIGAVLVPWGAILGVIAAMGTGCNIDFVDDKGRVTDIDGKVTGIYDKAKGVVVRGAKKLENNDTVGELVESLEDFAGKLGKTVKKKFGSTADSYNQSDAEDFMKEEMNDEEL